MNDDAVLVAEKAVEGASIGSIPGICWLQYFPFAKHIPSWIPGTLSKKLAKEYVPFVAAMVDKPYEEVKAALVRIFSTTIILNLSEP